MGASFEPLTVTLSVLAVVVMPSLTLKSNTKLSELPWGRLLNSAKPAAVSAKVEPVTV